MRNVIERRDRSRPGDHVRRYRHRADRVIVWGRGRPGPRVLHSGRLLRTLPGRRDRPRFAAHAAWRTPAGRDLVPAAAVSGQSC
jgi:hypothetical protein